MRYKFRLETLRKVREARRDQARVALAEAFRAEQVLIDRRAELAAEGIALREVQRSAAAGRYLDVNRLLEAQRYELLLAARGQELAKQTALVAAEIEHRRQALVEADRDVRVLELAALKGVFYSAVEESVTFVNAPLLAEERGVHLREISDPQAEDYVSLLRISGVRRDGTSIRVAGTIVHPGDRERLTEVWNTPVDVEPTRHMAFFRYEDRPGIIGRVGTGFGEANVNIAAAQVGRREAGGEAIMALSLDSAVPREVLERITAEIGASEGRAISL